VAASSLVFSESRVSPTLLSNGCMDISFGDFTNCGQRLEVLAFVLRPHIGRMLISV